MADEFDDPSGAGDFGSIIDSGDPGADPSPLTLDFYRGKAQQFQTVLLGLDSVYFDLQNIAQIASTLDDDGAAYSEAMALLAEFETRRGQFIATAQALNLASDGLNAVGIDFPQIQVGGLAAVPVAAVAAVAGAVAAAAALIYWTQQFYATVRNFLQRMQTLDAIAKLPPEQQASVMQSVIQADRDVAVAQSQADASPLAGAATLVKWAVIGAAIYFGYKVWKEGR